MFPRQDMVLTMAVRICLLRRIADFCEAEQFVDWDISCYCMGFAPFSMTRITSTFIDHNLRVARNLPAARTGERMKHLSGNSPCFSRWALLCCLFVLWGSARAAESTLGDSPMPKLDDDGNKVQIIQLHGTIDAKAARVLKFHLRTIEKDDAVKAVVIDFNSDGATLSAIEDVIRPVTRLDIPVYLFIDDHATGLSALLSFAVDGVYMVPSARIGAAVPSDMKTNKDGEPDTASNAKMSKIKAAIRSYAQTNGFRKQVGEAMVDPSVELKNGDKIISKKGDILTLTASDAAQKMPDGKRLHCHGIVEHLDDLLLAKGLDTAEKQYTTVLGDPQRYQKNDEAAPVQAVEAEKIETKEGDKVAVLEFHDAFDKPILFIFRRCVKQVKNDKRYKAIVIDMDTPGGRIDVMKEMIGLIGEVDVPVYLYIDNWAISAGAIFSFATDRIYMKEGSAIGAATPILASPEGGAKELPESIEEKFYSALKGTVRAIAEKNGYRPEIGEAMIDRNVEVIIGGEVVSEKGKLLTLTTQQAVRIMPDGKKLHAHGVANSVDEVLKLHGLVGVEKIEFKASPAEHIAKYIIMLSPLLFTLGIIAFFIEMKTPGFGVPGITAVICFGIAFFGHNVGEMAGYEQLILIVLGAILLLVEIFVIPGFGVCGILGILSMVGGMIWMMIPHIPSTPDIPNLDDSLLNQYLTSMFISLCIMVIFGAIAIVMINKFLPKTATFSKLVHQGASTSEEGYNGTSEAKNKPLIGKEGVAATVLRPSGIATIDGKRVDVVAEGAYIKKDQKLKVKDVKGVRIVVVPIDDEEEGGASS